MNCKAATLFHFAHVLPQAGKGRPDGGVHGIPGLEPGDKDGKPERAALFIMKATAEPAWAYQRSTAPVCCSPCGAGVTIWEKGMGLGDTIDEKRCE